MADLTLEQLDALDETMHPPILCAVQCTAYTPGEILAMSAIGKVIEAAPALVSMSRECLALRAEIEAAHEAEATWQEVAGKHTDENMRLAREVERLNAALEVWRTERKAIEATLGLRGGYVGRTLPQEVERLKGEIARRDHCHVCGATRGCWRMRTSTTRGHPPASSSGRWRTWWTRAPRKAGGMSDPSLCRHCGLEHSPEVFPCPHCQGTGKINPFDSPVSIEEQLYATKQDRDAWKRRAESAEAIAERGASIAGNTGSVKALWEQHRAEWGSK